MQRPARNRLDLFRLLAAFTVLFIHSFPIYGLKDYGYPYMGMVGDAAVMVFFTISGYLITGSFLAASSLRQFLINRVLRIFPGLAGVTLFCISLGACVTSLPTSTYLLNPDTWKFLQNTSIYLPVPTLPGVFTTNPIAGAINGSLWTLRIEFSMYLLVPVLAFFKLLTPQRILWVLAAFWITFLHALNVKEPPLIFHMESQAILKYGISFMIGATLYMWRERFPLRADVAWLILALLAGSIKTPFVGYATILLIPYPTLYFGLRPSRWRFPDISYGVYIFAFPLQQTYMHFSGHSRSVFLLPLTVLPCVILLALLSWYAIEKPALKLKRHSRRQIID